MELSYERLTIGLYPTLIENEHLARYRFAIQFVQGKRVADIACGSGYGTHLLAEGGAQSVHGLDVSEDAVAFCKQHYEAANIRFSASSAENLIEVPDEDFDVVCSFETIEHLADVSSYLREMVRILKPRGRFLVSTPDRRISSVLSVFGKRPANVHHTKEYTESELLKLLCGHFEIEDCYYQALVPRWLVFWPVQIFIKTACRVIGTAKATRFKDSIYSNGGKVDVTAKGSQHGIPKFLLISCVRPAN